MTLTEMTAAEAARRIAAGELAAEELVEACLERIGEVEETVGAWAHLDPEYARTQARECDEMRRSGRPVGPLHGVPVGIKDIIDTADLPTECGTELLAGRIAEADAHVVSLLKDAGAVIMGKTVTTEFAVYQPGKTANPHDPTRTPGGSSSGSAAAVATGMVPLALGTQTNGSVIRPAAYCGVWGFKPTRGRISRRGILLLSAALDTVGGFARSVEDVALLVECLARYDDRDPAMRPRGGYGLRRVALEDPPFAPNFAFVKTAVWDRAEADVRDGFAEIAAFLGEQCDEVDLPPLFADALGWHRKIMVADLARSLAAHYRRGKDRLSETLRAMIEEGQSVLAVDYNAGLDWIEVLNAGLDEIFARYDAIITPATAGEAPSIETTGSPAFCTLWTFTGGPAVTVPLLRGGNGLPIGVQLVGPRGDDARLLRTARWLADAVAGDAAGAAAAS